MLAESVGIDSFNIGEHYRPEFMDSAGHVVLAAIAGRTERIRLGTAVTVLSTQDPVRLYNNFATLDAVSDGRAQLIVGRGSLTESFPLFGFDLADYEELFEEKLDLLVAAAARAAGDLVGQVPLAADRPDRQPADPRGAHPDVGGRRRQPAVGDARGAVRPPADAGGHRRQPRTVRAARRALQARARALRAAALPVGLHSLGFVAATDEEAIEIQWPYWKEQFEWAARERGWRPPTSSSSSPRSSTARCTSGRRRPSPTGSPTSCRRSALSRFDLLYAVGRVPHEQRLATIELYGREVIPRVRELLAATGRRRRARRRS